MNANDSSKPQHTPGPWSAFELAKPVPDERTYWKIEGPQVAPYQGIYTTNGTDAALIAAAPELLAALRALVEVAAHQNEPRWHDWLEAKASEARALLARVDGGGQ